MVFFFLAVPYYSIKGDRKTLFGRTCCWWTEVICIIILSLWPPAKYTPSWPRQSSITFFFSLLFPPSSSDNHNNIIDSNDTGVRGVLPAAIYLHEYDTISSRGLFFFSATSRNGINGNVCSNSRSRRLLHYWRVDKILFTLQKPL